MKAAMKKNKPDNLLLITGSLLLVVLLCAFCQSQHEKAALEPDKDTRWLKDRLEINNVLYAYGVEWDRQNAGVYFDLFTPDAVFVVEQPDAPRQEYQFHTQFKPIALDRWKQFKEKGYLRRHFVNNIYYLNQDDSSANVVVYGLLGNVAEKKFHAVTSVYYEGKLKKRNGKWKIQHWLDKPDAVLDVPVLSKEK